MAGENSTTKPFRWWSFTINVPVIICWFPFSVCCSGHQWFLLSQILNGCFPPIGHWGKEAEVLSIFLMMLSSHITNTSYFIYLYKHYSRFDMWLCSVWGLIEVSCKSWCLTNIVHMNKSFYIDMCSLISSWLFEVINPEQDRRQFSWCSHTGSGCLQRSYSIHRERVWLSLLTAECKETQTLGSRNMSRHLRGFKPEVPGRRPAAAAKISLSLSLYI